MLTSDIELDVRKSSVFVFVLLLFLLTGDRNSLGITSGDKSAVRLGGIIDKKG